MSNRIKSATLATLAFLSLTVVVWLPHHFSFSIEIKNSLGHWNWLWVFTLILGSFIGNSLWKLGLGRHLRPNKTIITVLLGYCIILATYCLYIGVPAETLFSLAVINTFIFQISVSTCEEFYFRGVGIGAIDRGRSTSPVWALLSTSLGFGLLHGLNPLMNGEASFAWDWFISTALLGLFWGFIYLRTKSIGLAAFAHFFLNTGGLFLLDRAKVIQDLDTHGRILWP